MKEQRPSLVAAVRRGLAELALDLFPARCPLCGEPEAEPGFGCARHVLPHAPPPPRCARCAAALAPALADGGRCPACRERAPGFARVVALGDYRASPGLAAWLLALKHGRRADLARPLGEALGARLAGELAASGPSHTGSNDRAPVLVPVPLHRWRRIERGHDQALLLALAAAESAGLPVVRALVRTRATPTQGAVGSPGRRANVHGAFAVRRSTRARLAARAVLLVDDVVTSGATAAECARVLRAAGARRVAVLCVARAGAGQGQAGQPAAHEDGRS